MGWKTFYSVSEDYFRDLYDKAEKWGDLNPYKLTVQGEEHYGAGNVSNAPTSWILSPKIQHYIGKTKITVKYYLWVESGVTGKASIGIVFYKNDQTSVDESGYDVHGGTHTVTSAPSANTAEPHELVIEQENNKIVYYIDGNKLGEANLQAPLTSFKIALKVDEANNGNIGIVVTSVTAEYYDYIEDMLASMMNVMNIMMWVMMAVMIIALLVKAFKPKKKEEVVKPA